MSDNPQVERRPYEVYGASHYSVELVLTVVMKRRISADDIEWEVLLSGIPLGLTVTGSRPLDALKEAQERVAKVVGKLLVDSIIHVAEWQPETTQSMAIPLQDKPVEVDPDATVTAPLPVVVEDEKDDDGE
jgi:hypothetical protein